MRLVSVGVALTALAVAVPIKAASIVQMDNELVCRGFDSFDVSLGTLNKVTLSTTIYKSRAWIARLSGSAGETFAVDWSVAGEWTMSAQGTDIAIDLVGSGTSEVKMVQGPVPGSAHGFFDTDPLRGSGTFDLNPDLFTSGHILLNGRDPGFNSDAGDTVFSGPAGMTFQSLGGSCYVFDGVPSFEQADDLCGWVSHKLTYDYTPAGAVPEPATWAMMILGFGAVGYAMRRKTVLRFALCPA